MAEVVREQENHNEVPIPAQGDEHQSPPRNGIKLVSLPEIRWDPFTVLISAFYALCAAAGLDSTVTHFRDRADEHLVGFSRNSLNLYYPNVEWIDVSMIVVCITYLTWLYLHYTFNFRSVQAIPGSPVPGAYSWRRIWGFIFLAVSIFIFYVFGLILTPPTHSMLLLILMINVAHFPVPWYLLRGYSGIVPEDLRKWWVVKNAVGIFLPAVLLWVPMTETVQIWLPFVGYPLVLLTLPFSTRVVFRLNFRFAFVGL